MYCNALYSGNLHNTMNGIVNKTLLAQQSVADAERKQPKQVTMPEECVKSLQDLQSPEAQAAAQKCEEAGTYGDKAVEALQAADEKAAVAHVREVFEKCGKLPEKCAALVAPRLVQEMRVSGFAVSDACKAEYRKTRMVQNDEKALAGIAACDKKELLADKTLTALNNGDGVGAIDATEQGLEMCMNTSKSCAFQLAPVIVNSLIMRAMQEAAITQVLVAQPVLIVEADPVVVVEDDGAADAPANEKELKKKMSFTQMAASIRPAGKSYKKRNSMVREAAVTPALVETAHSHQRSTSASRLLIDLLVKRNDV